MLAIKAEPDANETPDERRKTAEPLNSLGCEKPTFALSFQDHFTKPIRLLEIKTFPSLKRFEPESVLTQVLRYNN